MDAHFHEASTGPLAPDLTASTSAGRWLPSHLAPSSSQSLISHRACPPAHTTPGHTPVSPPLGLGGLLGLVVSKLQLTARPDLTDAGPGGGAATDRPSGR